MRADEPLARGIDGVGAWPAGIAHDHGPGRRRAAVVAEHERAVRAALLDRSEVEVLAVADDRPDQARPVHVDQRLVVRALRGSSLVVVGEHEPARAVAELVVTAAEPVERLTEHDGFAAFDCLAARDLDREDEAVHVGGAARVEHERAEARHGEAEQYPGDRQRAKQFPEREARRGSHRLSLCLWRWPLYIRRGGAGEIRNRTIAPDSGRRPSPSDARPGLWTQSWVLGSAVPILRQLAITGTAQWSTEKPIEKRLRGGSWRTACFQRRNESTS